MWQALGGQAVDLYTGGWLSDSHSGLGRLTMSTGETYEGEWRGGQRHGRGICYYPDGDCYVGEWVDGVRQGTGTLADSKGSGHEGVAPSVKSPSVKSAKSQSVSGR